MKKKTRHAALIVATAAALAQSGCGDAGSARPKKACRESAPGSQTQGLATSSRLFLTTSVVTRLQTRAAAGDAAWTQLKKVCDGYATGTVHAPGGNAYPGSTSIGSGYQGDGYLDAIQAIGLCYRTTKGVDEASAAKYAAVGIKVLEAMSTPAASGGAKPSTDSGYGIRNYGVGMAIGFDWLYSALSPATKAGVVAALNSWVDWYDQSGFLKNDPIANYFVGYLLAKTYTALATGEDNPKAATYWGDVQTKLWGQLVKPKYQAWMKGGGWPEGWGYGPRAVRGVAEFLWAVKTAKNLDWHTELPQARDQAAYLRYFAWPAFTRMDDQGTVRSGIDLHPSASLYTSLATISAELGDPQAPVAASFAADVLAKGKDDRAAWQKFLYWDPSLPKASYQSQPLSYLAEGPGHVAMRSGWDAAASWAALSSGRYINAQDSGEQMFNAGGVAFVVGGDPLLVNASGWIPSTAGTAGEDFVYSDSWGGGGRRLYNTFFVVNPGSSSSPGQNTASPTSSKAHLESYDDGGNYVRARAQNLEDQYGSSSSKPVTSYTRDLVYLRPGTLVLFDATTVAQAGADRWMAFHTPSAPTKAATASGQHRYDIVSGGAQKGSLRILLPPNVSPTTVALPGGTTRIEAHAGGAASQTWLSVVTASGSVPEQTRLSAGDGNVQSGGAVGVEIHSAREQIVLFPQPGTKLGGAAYSVKAGVDADHVLVDVAPSASGYSITAQAGSGGLVVSLTPGGSFQPTAAGVLSFSISKAGVVEVPTTGGPPGNGTGGSAGSGGSTGGGGTGGAPSAGGSAGANTAGAAGAPEAGGAAGAGTSGAGGEPNGSGGLAGGASGGGSAPSSGSGGSGNGGSLEPSAGASDLPPCD